MKGMMASMKAAKTATPFDDSQYDFLGNEQELSRASIEVVGDPSNFHGSCLTCEECQKLDQGSDHYHLGSYGVRRRGVLRGALHRR